VVTVAPNNNKPAPPSKTRTYFKCVGQTAAEDAFWGGVTGAVVGVGSATILSGAAGAEGGPAGVAVGAAGGFIVGVVAIPITFIQGALTGGGLGLIHGAIGCIP
jgi:hypothetical protein